MKKTIVANIALLSTLLTMPAYAGEEGGFGAYLEKSQVAPTAQASAPAEPAKLKKKKKKKEAVAASAQASEDPATGARGLAAISAPDLPGKTPEAGASRFKFGAFADLRFTRVSAHDDPNVANANSESGFGLEDAALTGTYDSGKVGVVFDLAFRRAKDFDVNPSAAVPNQSNTNNFGIGVDKSQLYVKYRVNDNFLVDFGQFDTIFGVELNDSKDRVFGKTGLVYDAMIPTTHTGFMAESTWNGFYAKGFAANPASKGSLGTSTSGDERIEFGGALGYANDMIHGQIGGETRSINNADGAASNRNMIDATVGTSLGAFALDLEAARLSDGSKNKLTPSDTGDKEKAGMGYFALATYKISEPLLIGVRWEELRNDPMNTTTSATDSSGKGISLHYRLSPELELRSEYIDYRFKNESNQKWNGSRFNCASVISF